MNRHARITLFAAGAAAVLVTTGSATVYGVSSRKLARTFDAPPASLQIPQDDAAALARGEHLVHAITICGECHAPDLGGQVLVDDAPMGFLPAPNLTSGRGGIGSTYTVDDWVRALRYGITREGKSLMIMPSESFAHLSDDDLGAIIAYLQQVPPVDREFAPRRIGPLGRALLAAGQLELIAEKVERRERYDRPAAEPTIEYGRYLAGIGGCMACHTPDLSGGIAVGPPEAPLSSNLTTAGLVGWTEADFVRAMREGVRPDGSQISEFMPWRFAASMTDEELHTLWLFLQSLPPVEPAKK
jgi:mono/diheme cytochrome c family protein